MAERPTKHAPVGRVTCTCSEGTSQRNARMHACAEAERHGLLAGASRPRRPIPPAAPHLQSTVPISLSMSTPPLPSFSATRMVGLPSAATAATAGAGQGVRAGSGGGGDSQAAAPAAVCNPSLGGPANHPWLPPTPHKRCERRCRPPASLTGQLLAAGGGSPACAAVRHRRAHNLHIGGRWGGLEACGAGLEHLGQPSCDPA